jgi:hypothetical protein
VGQPERFWRERLKEECVNHSVREGRLPTGVGIPIMLFRGKAAGRSGSDHNVPEGRAADRGGSAIMLLRGEAADRSRFVRGGCLREWVHP